MQGEKSKFEIKPVVEQRPFESPAVLSFFIKWCEINDSIQPTIVDRNDWNQRRTKGVLEKTPDGKQILYIPKDLQLWEMVGVMEAVDRDTFATKPERQTEAKEKLMKIGKTFRNTGIYIAQRMNSIKRGRDIAVALALEFYDYGQSLMEGKKPENSEDTDAIASQFLTPSEIETIDRFLGGDDLYEPGQRRAEKALRQSPGDTAQTGLAKREEFYEIERRKTLAKFFRSAEKAFELTQKSEDEELHKNRDVSKPWQSDTPVHSSFLKKVKKAVIQKIEVPRREFETSIFRRGMELLQRNMPSGPLPEDIKRSILHWDSGEKTLRGAIRVDLLKAELEEVRRLGDQTQISAKEQEIANKIQEAISTFPKALNMHNPTKMVVDQYVNCLGASELGGALMKEAGLYYLVGDVPRHSVLFLVTSDGRVEWRDMLAAHSNEELTDDMVDGQKSDGSPITIADIVEFSKNPKPEGLMFDIKSERYREKLPWVEEGQRQYVTVFEPEYGQQIQLLNNTGNALSDLGEHEETPVELRHVYSEEAVEAYRQAIAFGPKYPYAHNGLGNTLYHLGHYDEAIEEYRKAIEINPKFSYSYSGLGNSFYTRGHYDEAIAAYRKAIALDPKYAYPHYNLGIAFRARGNHKEAVEEYRTFLNLADRKKDGSWIKKAEERIAELEKKHTKIKP